MVTAGTGSPPFTVAESDWLWWRWRALAQTLVGLVDLVQASAGWLTLESVILVGFRWARLAPVLSCPG